MNRDAASEHAPSVDEDGLPVVAADGHRFRLLQVAPDAPTAALLWLPALGVAARHYLPFAETLSARGIAVFMHEWRGHGSSCVRAGRDCDWSYRALLGHDLPAAARAVATAYPALPRIIGGHSLGAQLAACFQGLQPDTARRLWLVASGSPYWRVFPSPRRWWLPLAYRFLPWLADRNGALPGRRIGFAGNEARGVMRDWARTALSGRYTGAEMDRDLEAALANVVVDTDTVLLSDDWLAPRASLDFLLAKMRPAATHCTRLDAVQLGTRAGHFDWMKQPDAVASALVATLQPAS